MVVVVVVVMVVVVIFEIRQSNDYAQELHKQIKIAFINKPRAR